MKNKNKTEEVFAFDEKNSLYKEMFDKFVKGKDVYKTETIEALEKKPFYDLVKRLFDIIVSLCVLIIGCIPMFIIAVIIKLDSKGPAFFVQERLGYNQKKFKIIKFRSMILDAEKESIKWATESDERVTRVGKFLRKTRLDELPQFVNILFGQMSLVGPRPERAEFYNLFDLYIDGFRQRMLVKPGLTGHAQVNGGYDLLPEEKIKFDIEYIKKRSVKMDLTCIFNTVKVIFTGNGAR